MTTLEVWEDPATKVRFLFSHSTEAFTTGVMVIPPHAELPKHHRPLAIENLTQVSGRSLVKVFVDGGTQDYNLEIGQLLRIPKAKYHVHSNPYDEASVTLFKADGDITSIMNLLRGSFTHVDLAPASQV